MLVGSSVGVVYADMQVMARGQELLRGGKNSVEDSDEPGYGILNTLLGNEDDCSHAVATGVYFSSPFGTSFKPWNTSWISSTTWDS